MSYILQNKQSESAQLPKDLTNFIDNIINDKSKSTFLILPTGKYVNNITNRIIRQYYAKHSKPVARPKVTTLSNLVEYAFNSLSGLSKYKILSEAYLLVLMEECIDISELSFFKQNNQKVPFGVVQKLYNLIYGIKEDGITPEQIGMELSLSSKEIFDSKKLKDIFIIYSKYQDLLSNRYFDKTEVLKYVTALFEEDKKNVNRVFGNNSQILLYGFSEFKKPEIDFLVSLANSEIALTLNLDYNHALGPIFAGYERISSAFLKYNSINDSSTQFSSQKDLFSKDFSKSAYLRRYLFKTDEKLQDVSSEFKDIIKVIAVNDAESEIEFVAKLVRSKIVYENYSPSDICIVARNPIDFVDLIREKFKEYSVPQNITERNNLISSPIVIAILSFLRIYINGFKKTDIHKALYSTYHELDKSENKIRADVLMRIANLLRIEGGTIRGGDKVWKHRLEGRIRSLENILYEQNYFFENEYDKENLRKELEEVKLSYSYFNTLSQLYKSFKKKVNSIEFKDLVLDLIEEVGIYNQIDKMHKTEKIDSLNLDDFEELEKEAKAFDTFNALLNEFSYIMQDRFGNKEFLIEELLSKFETALSGEKYQISEKRGIGVTFTTIEQTRGLDYKILILVGANEGSFPKPYNIEKMLGKELIESESNHISNEKTQFYQFLTNSKSNLDRGDLEIYICYAQKDEDKELSRSHYIDILFKTIGMDINAIINLNANNHELKFIDKIASKKELLLNTNIMDISRDAVDSYLNKYDLNYLKDQRIANIQKRYIKLLDSDKLDIEYLNKLNEYKNKQFSISTIETYAECPYMYFTKNILKIEQEKETDYSLKAIELGSLMHKVLFDFYMELSKIGKDERIEIIENKLYGVKLQKSKKDEYLKLLLKKAEDEIQRYSFDHPFFEIERTKLLGDNFIKGYFELWLLDELDRAGKINLVPAFFEKSFENEILGNAKKEIKLRGKIDRVELIYYKNELYFMIADYKTSIKSTPSNPSIQAAKKFQISLYMQVFKEILARELEMKVHYLGGIYYGITPKSDKNVKFVLTHSDINIIHQKDVIKQKKDIFDTEKLDTILKKSLSVAIEIKDKISNGEFPVTPNSTACNYCEYKSLCKIEHLKKN